MTTHPCGQGERLWALYEEGEAASLGRHLLACAPCRARAATEAPEALFALLAEPPADFTLGAAKRTYRPADPWLDGLRRAASVLLVAGCAWGGYVLYRGNTALSPETPLAAASGRGTTKSSPSPDTVGASAGEDLRARYPLVRHASPATPYYTATLDDGTRLVHFHVPEL